LVENKEKRLQDDRKLEKLPEGKLEEKGRRNMSGTKEGRKCGT
jgi:hypothetical protein